jgi:hypothetical protein
MRDLLAEELLAWATCWESGRLGVRTSRGKYPLSKAALPWKVGTSRRHVIVPGGWGGSQSANTASVSSPALGALGCPRMLRENRGAGAA